MKIEVSDKSAGDTLKSILKLLQDIVDLKKDQAKTAAAIRHNTRLLSGLSTNPPSKNPQKEHDMTDSGQAVNDALAEQTQAIANLGAELADEHQEWLDAVAAGDSGQADAVVAKVKENTAQLQALSDQLASSHPGSSDTPTATPQR